MFSAHTWGKTTNIHWQPAYQKKTSLLRTNVQLLNLRPSSFKEMYITYFLEEEVCIKLRPNRLFPPRGTCSASRFFLYTKRDTKRKKPSQGKRICLLFWGVRKEDSACELRCQVFIAHTFFLDHLIAHPGSDPEVWQTDQVKAGDWWECKLDSTRCQNFYTGSNNKWLTPVDRHHWRTNFYRQKTFWGPLTLVSAESLALFQASQTTISVATKQTKLPDKFYPEKESFFKHTKTTRVFTKPKRTSHKTKLHVSPVCGQ